MDVAPLSIYNASAGAGKTYTLAKEYIKILLSYPSPDSYKRILAITFTNKAVKEMKQRIIGYLEEIAYLPDNAEHPFLQNIIEETGYSREYIKSKCRKILFHLLHNYSNFGISTIDKFTQKIVRSFASELGLSNNFEVSIDEKEIVEQTIDTLMQRIGSDSTIEDERLTNLLLEFSKLRVEKGKSWDVSSELIAMGGQMLLEVQIEKLKPYKNQNIESLLAIKNVLLEEFTITRKQIEEDVLAIVKLYESEGIKNEDFLRGTYPRRLFAVAKLEPKGIEDFLDAYVEEGTIKLKKTEEYRLDPIRGQLLEQTRQLNQRVKKYIVLEKILDKWTALVLLSEIDKTLHSIQNEQNIVSISSFNKIIHEELKNQPAAYIYEKIGERYSHFFIDEFQDTSVIQWENLIPLIDNAVSGLNAQEKPGSVMLVGDPKQSIYRFRGGDVNQFMRLSDEQIDSPFVVPEKKVYRLQNNYRSFKEIITFNNLFFEFVADEFATDEYKTLYKYHSKQTNIKENKGFVSIQFAPISDTKEETKEFYFSETLKTIEQVVERGYHYSDICILCRKNNDAKEMASYLISHGVQVISSDSLLLSNSVEVKIITQVLLLLLDIKNKEAIVLLLYSLVEKYQDLDKVHDTIDEVIIEQKTIEEEALEKVLDKNFGITFSFEKARSLPLFDCVVYVINQMIVVEQESSYMQYFKDLVLNQSLSSKNSLSDFVDYWLANQDKIAIPTAKNKWSVEITTIHKSKGLEYPVVIIPNTTGGVMLSNKQAWIPTSNEKVPEAMMNLTKLTSKLSDEAREIIEQYEENEKFDIINTLYVAFTRAEQELYILSDAITDENGKNKDFVCQLLQSFLVEQGLFNEQKHTYTFGEKEHHQPKEEKETSVPFELSIFHDKLEKEQVKIATLESLLWDDAKAQAIDRGNILHQMLSEIHTIEDVPFVLMRAELNAWVSLDEKEEWEELLKSIIQHPDLGEFFDDSFRTFSETPLLKKGRKTLKPDRVSFKDKKAYLLDYKTGQYHKKHEIQLDEYTEALEDMGFEVEKKVLVYIQKEIKIINL